MKTFATLLLLFTLSALHAAPVKKIEAAVTRAMDNILSDTVNEGEGQAYVSKAACSVAKKISDPSVDVVKCSIDFAVTFGDAQCSTNCFMIYTMKNGDLKTLKANEGLESRCIENLSETYCD